MGLGNGVERTKIDGDGEDGDGWLWREVGHGGKRMKGMEGLTGQEVGTFLLLKRISVCWSKFGRRGFKVCGLTKGPFGFLY